MIENSLICKLINVQASMKENNEKKIWNCERRRLMLIETYKPKIRFPKVKISKRPWQ